jgi:hypothetical protein
LSFGRFFGCCATKSHRPKANHARFNAIHRKKQSFFVQRRLRRAKKGKIIIGQKNAFFQKIKVGH